MRLMNNRYYLDLLLAFVISSLFYLLFFFMPGSKLMRAVLGIPFLFFIPGYMITALLFPPVQEDEDEEEDPPPVKRSRFGFKFSKKEEGSDEEKIERGVDWPIRIALSVGISLGVVGIVSWILNDLYPINPEFFGVRSDRMVLIIYILSVVCAGGAIIRRSRLDPEMQEKFRIPSIRLFENDPRDIIITSTLILILIGAIGYGVYLRQHHHPASDRYTELYILGPDQKIEGYPSIVMIDELRTLYLGLANHEFESRDYDIVMSLDYQGFDIRIDDLSDLRMNRSVKYLFNISLGHGHRFEEPISFFFDTQGQYLFSIMVLDKDGSKYREVKLDITALEPSNMIRSDDMIMYLADEYGIPSDLPATHWNENILSFKLVIVNNDLSDPINTNVTLNYGTRTFYELIEPFSVHALNSSTVLYSTYEIPAQSRYSYHFSIILPKGNFDMIIQLNRDDLTTFHRGIRVQ
ncbi:MAG: DUF1616 domain-containing protein [Candidatus Thermoplasmatota archaeon]|nr:DUF1616 domain-containing protein [Candidatus Thermoplasmatota archaeon]